MKLMIASDLHGSSYYCKKVLDTFRQEQADRLLLLGDILYHGPRNDLPKDYDPKAVIAMLNEHKDELFCVRGNCDTEVDQMVLDFPILADYSIITLGKRLMYATHGHKFTPQNLPLKEGDIYIQGHTHVPRCTTTDKGVLWLNPGSVSIPKEHSHHQYMIYENGVFEWKDLAGSVLHTLEIDIHQ